MPLTARHLTARHSIATLGALLLALTVAALAPAARAQSVTSLRPGVAVFGTPRIINVGILRLGGPTGQNGLPAWPAGGGQFTSVADPLRGAYLFYILNNRPDILPSVWTLKNPNAPTRVDAAITARFPIANTGYSQDQPVTQMMAPYWEIDGDTITTTLGLSAYDLILITTNQVIALTLEQRRALRQFIDKGGTLWIDTVPGATLDQSLIFHAKLGATFPAGGASTNDLSHPLATGYYTLSSSDLDNLGLTKVGGSRQILSDVSGNVGSTPDLSLFHAVNTFSTTGSANFGSIAAADYGNGHILITDRDISDDINDTVGAYPNESGTSGTNFLNAPAADLKFVVNVLAWASNANGPGGGARNDNAQPGAVAGAIQSNWSFSLPTSAGATAQTGIIGTATYGNRVYVSSSDGDLRAFDINPSETLDPTAASGGDDYGVNGTDPVTGVSFKADYSRGYPYDELWGLHVFDHISAPTTAEVPVTSNGATMAVNRHVVLVETQTGYVEAYDAVTGAHYASASAPGDGSSFSTAQPIPAPTYYRGRIFATQKDGYVKVSYPGTSVMPFRTRVELAGNTTLSQLAVQSIPGADRVGYNGDDIVGYTYDTAGSPSSNIYALFLGSRDESEKYLSYNGAAAGATMYQTIQQILPNLAGLTVYGAPEDTDDTLAGLNWLFNFPNTSPAANAAIAVQQPAAMSPVTTNTVQSATTATTPAGAMIYGDYDLMANNTQMNMIRTTINAQVAANPAPAGSTLIQGIAIGSVSQGIAASLSNIATAFNTANDVYVTVNEANNNAYIMSVKERSPGVAPSQISWRFALVNTTDAEGVTYAFGGYKFVGAPVCDGNGYVYALATNGTSTRLMAFFANAVCGFVAPFTATTVTQTDELGNQESIVPAQFPTGGIFADFSASATGTLTPNLTMPLPVTVAGTAQDGTTTTVQIPVSTALGAQPLLAWWVELPASAPIATSGVTSTLNVTPTSPLRKIGNTLYFGGQEVSVTTSTTGTPPPVTSTDNALFAVYADPIGIGIQADPATRQITSSDYRLVQVTPSGVGQISVPPAGFGKYIVTAAGPYTYTNASGTTVNASGGVEGFGFVPTLITDNHRLLETDPAGNATWIVDSTRESATQTIAGGATVPVKTIVPLNRPTSLTQFSTDDYLLADTGNNRVVHIGRIGDVLAEMPDKFGHLLLATTVPQAGPPAVAAKPHVLEITGFSDPAGILAPGAPTTLNQPSNVTFWMTYDHDPTVTPLLNPPTVITAHYLICDSGNNRIVEVDDRYTQDTTNYAASAQVFDFAQDQDYHQLVWVTKTTENGHTYQYAAAQALFDSNAVNPLTGGPAAIAGIVANARVSAVDDLTGLPNLNTTTGVPALSALASSAQDAQGSAVLVFAYAPINYQYTGTGGPGTTQNPYTAPGAQDGLPFVVVNSVLADNAPTLTPQPLQTTDLPAYMGMGVAVTAPTPYVGYPLRGLRSIQIYNFALGTPATTAPAAPAVPTSFGMVIADDDGVFDGSYNSYPTNPNTTPMTLAGTALDATTTDYGWSFRQSDYCPPPTSTPPTMPPPLTSIVGQNDAIVDVQNSQPLSGTGIQDYWYTPFSPASALRLANNSYIIVNRGGSGNPNSIQMPSMPMVDTDFGGNVFTVRAAPGANGKRVNGGTLSGQIIGKPANTGALDGPSFALKSN